MYFRLFLFVLFYPEAMSGARCLLYGMFYPEAMREAQRLATFKGVKTEIAYFRLGLLYPEAVPEGMPDVVPEAVPEGMPDAAPEAVRAGIPDAAHDAIPEAIDEAAHEASRGKWCISHRMKVP